MTLVSHELADKLFMRKVERNRFLKLNHRGFSLIEVITAIAISSMVVIGTSSMIVSTAKQESVQARQFWIAARRIQFQNIVRTQPGWASILAANPQMACFTNGTSCSEHTALQPLRLPVDANVFDGAVATTGMTNKGDYCNSYDEAHGSTACPVGVTLQWQALCDDMSCVRAQPKLVIKFKIKDPDQPLDQLASYDLVLFKDPRLESLNEICTAMGGTLVGFTCSIGSLATACDPSNALGAGATYPLGFDNSGAVICGKPNPGSCAASDVAVGFNASGVIQCAPACL